MVCLGVLLRAVGRCNGDNMGNLFIDPFPVIEEDAPPYRLLCNAYLPAKQQSEEKNDIRRFQNLRMFFGATCTGGTKNFYRARNK